MLGLTCDMTMGSEKSGCCPWGLVNTRTRPIVSHMAASKPSRFNWPHDKHRGQRTEARGCKHRKTKSHTGNARAAGVEGERTRKEETPNLMMGCEERGQM